nr:chromatin target of PRMT1 protein-like [Ipomoea batatas]
MATIGSNNDGSIGESYKRTASEVVMFAPLQSNNSLSSAHHFVSIKLTFRNYLFWRTQLIPLLRGQGLLGHVDGSLQCLSLAPPEEVPADGVSPTSAALSHARDA